MTKVTINETVSPVEIKVYTKDMMYQRTYIVSHYITKMNNGKLNIEIYLMGTSKGNFLLVPDCEISYINDKVKEEDRLCSCPRDVWMYSGCKCGGK